VRARGRAQKRTESAESREQRDLAINPVDRVKPFEGKRHDGDNDQGEQHDADDILFRVGSVSRVSGVSRVRTRQQEVQQQWQ
jgi:hypothetical protein